jgi:hypothetical protein
MGHYVAVVDDAGNLLRKARPDELPGTGRAFRAKNPRDLTIHENPSPIPNETMDYDDTASQVAEGSIDLLEAAVPILAGQLTASQVNATVAPMISTPGSTLYRIARFATPLLVGVGLYGYSTNQYVQGAAVGMGFESARVALSEIQALLMPADAGSGSSNGSNGSDGSGTEGLARVKTSVRRLPRSQQLPEQTTSSTDVVAAV